MHKHCALVKMRVKYLRLRYTLIIGRKKRSHKIEIEDFEVSKSNVEISLIQLSWQHKSQKLYQIHLRTSIGIFGKFEITWKERKIC